MNKILYFLLLLFVFAPFVAKGQGGCDALIKDARTLAKNLKFDEAVKKVEAAKGCASQADIDRLYSEIFAGLKKQTKDAEIAKEKIQKQEIATRALLYRSDSLYNMVVKEQAQSNLMRNSVAESTMQNLRMQEKIALLIQLDDLEELGDNEFKNKNYEKSVDYYSELISNLEKSENIDSSLIRKGLVAHQKLAKSSQILSEIIKFDACMNSGDSLLSKGLYYLPDAYHSYLNAKDLNFGKDTLITIIKKMECCISSNLKKVKTLPNIKYIELMATSGEANRFMHNDFLSKKRIRQAMKLSKPDSSFINDLELFAYAKRYEKMFFHRIAFYGETEILFGNKHSATTTSSGYGQTYKIENEFAHISSQTNFGILYSISPRLDIGLNFSKKNVIDFLGGSERFFHYADPNSMYISTDRKWSLHPFGLFSFYNSSLQKNKKNKISIKIQGIGGLQRYTNPGIYLGYKVFSSKEWNGLLGYKPHYSDTDLGNGYLVDRFILSPNYDSTVISITEISKGTKKSINLYFGGRISCSPFRYIPNLECYLGVTRKVSLDRDFKKIVRFNLNEVAYKNIQQNHIGFDENATKEFLDKNWNYNVEIAPYSRNLLYLWSIKCGVTYRL